MVLSTFPMRTDLSVMSPKTIKQKTIDGRVAQLEKTVDRYLPIWDALAKEYDLAKPRYYLGPACKDELDRRIVDYLIENGSGATTEIAKALGLENPKIVGRHIIGKRLKRLQEFTERQNWSIFEFHPEQKEGKFRAWWIRREDVDVEGFRKAMGKSEQK